MSSLASSLLYLPLVSNEEVKDPVIQSLIRPEEYLKKLHHIYLEKLQFIGDSLKILRQEVEEHAAALSFVGAPWTLHQMYWSSII